ncbi:MAG: hypothetical protein ACYCT1_01870 [Steroidobacteraceae bacterium]
MARWLAQRDAQPQPVPVRLELSGVRLEASLARLTAGCEAHGGIERYVQAVKLKSAMFREALGAAGEGAAELEPEAFKGLCTFMATVRRRIAPWLERPDFDGLREALVRLVRVIGDTGSTDREVAAFGSDFVRGERERWIRDLAVEILHNVAPERFPLMNRWVWDVTTNTGALREIWHDPQGESARIEVPDTYAMFLTLREELSGFLSGNGFFRDVIYYVDLLCAQVYAEYICEQGGSYLRTDFAAEDDPLQYTRRLLGLDGVRAGSGRTRLKTIDGKAFVLSGSTSQGLLD